MTFQVALIGAKRAPHFLKRVTPSGLVIAQLNLFGRFHFRPNHARSKVMTFNLNNIPSRCNHQTLAVWSQAQLVETVIVTP
jgi:hypothetical protein